MRRTLLTLMLLAAPRAALACPVCFGQSDSPMAAAANLSILVMLGIVGGVLAGFASFFIYLMRRARMMADEPSPAEAGRSAEASGYVVSSKGTAQC